MEADAQTRAWCVEQPVLDHLRGGAHQAEGVRVVLARRGNIEYRAAGRPVRTGAPGEQIHCAQEVLAAMHDQRPALG
jgi:hypothetical protein